MTTVSIHQPGYLPWLGFFKKMLCSDIFVFLDDAQYKKKQWHSRNKIRTSNGATWLTVPVKAEFGTNLSEIRIDNSADWVNLHKKSLLLNYASAEFFERLWKSMERIYDKKYELLIDVNMEFIKFILEQLQINTKTIFSSELQVYEKGSKRILNICKILNADEYISGILGKNYIDEDDFAKNNIKVRFQNFEHPVYKQCFTPFIPNMASIDLLFNEGEKSKEILRNAQS